MNTQLTAKTAAQRLLLQLIKMSDTGTGGWRRVRAVPLADTLGYSPRTTRDILALFLDHDIVCLAGNDCYAILEHYATDRAALVAAFDAIPFAPVKTPTNKPARKAPSMTTQTNTRTTGAATPNGTCGCCNAPIGKKSRFAPGHDARFVSNLVSDLVASIGTDGANHGTYRDVMTRTAELVRTAYSDALANKFAAAAERALTRPQRTQRTTTTPETWQAADPIKVRRWTYPARQDKTGRTQRNTKRDGSGTWVDVQGA